MKIPNTTFVTQLHSASAAVLATHSASLQGYPFASGLPYVSDQGHCPVFLISSLAEHTRNLRADARASLLIQTPGGEPEASPRLTLMGKAIPIQADAALCARYLRYLPHAQRYLELGDFSWFRFVPQRLRMVAGFGQAGWIEEDQWQTLNLLPVEEEADLLARARPDSGLLGIDSYGVDLRQNGASRRLAFEQPLSGIDLTERLKAENLIA